MFFISIDKVLNPDLWSNSKETRGVPDEDSLDVRVFQNINKVKYIMHMVKKIKYLGHLLRSETKYKFLKCMLQGKGKIEEALAADECPDQGTWVQHPPQHFSKQEQIKWWL